MVKSTYDPYDASVARYFLDTEFLSVPESSSSAGLHLVSLGIVCNDGRELSLQSVEFPWEQADEWVRAHVYPRLDYCSYGDHKHSASLGSIHLSCVYHQGLAHAGTRTPLGKCDLPDCPWRTLSQIREEVTAFLSPDEYGPPEIHAWCGAHDFVLLCSVMGGFAALPTGWPHYLREFQQDLDDRHIADDQLPEQEAHRLHHALWDARRLRDLWGYVLRNDAWQPDEDVGDDDEASERDPTREEGYFL